MFGVAVVAGASTSEIADKREELKIVVEKYIKAVAIENNVSTKLVQIARCESGMRQFMFDGTLLRGEINPKDVGLFQINEKYHLKESRELGMDIYTIEGNVAYAVWLAKNQGYRPWIHSKGCHGLA